LLIQVHKQVGIRSLKGKVFWEGSLDEQRQARLLSEK